MVLFTWLEYLFDGHWDGIFEDSVIFRHSWSGTLGDKIRSGKAYKLEFRAGVTTNLFTEKNQKYLKSVKHIIFYKNKNSEYIREKMIIPDNVEDIWIYYYGSKPNFDFEIKRDYIIHYMDMEFRDISSSSTYDNTDYVGNFDRYEDKRGRMF